MNARMKIVTFVSGIIAIPIALATGPTWGSRDPRTRDEDISSTSLAARAERVGSDYRYTYTLSTPATSVGRVRWFNLDIGCRQYRNTSPDRIRGGAGVPYNNSMDGRQVDARLRVVDVSGFVAGITPSNEAMFTLDMPRNATMRAEILSTSKPGYRMFHFDPSTTDNMLQYDYSNVDESEYDDPEIPSDEDWEVYGLIMGPACTGQEATPMTRPIFDGQPMRDETRTINQLLQYEIKGNRNRFHAPASQTDVKLKVYYSSNIDKTSFTAVINGRDISSLFTPEPGTIQDVVIPLNGARSLINISVYQNGARDETGQFDRKKRDLDPFEIRRPLP